jgi:PAS domain-containing protein
LKRPYALLCLIGLISLFTLSCATVPDWAASPSAIRAVYPDGDFIAQRGRGATREAAEVAAAAEIARFFTSQISANIVDRVSIKQQNGEVTESSESFAEALVQSQIDLFGIRFAQDAFYNTAEKQWQTVAYIDRNEAWTVYEPRVKRQADAFEAFYTAAEHESGQFRKALRFASAAAYARSEDFVKDFVEAEAFGQILHSQKMDASFGGIRAEIAAIPQKINDAKQNADVFIDCPGDFESLVTNAFSQGLSAEGFLRAENSNGADVRCKVTITEGRQERELGIFYNSSLQAVFTDASGVVFTFNAAAERASAVTPDVAKRRAYTALAEKVVGSFSIAGN